MSTEKTLSSSARVDPLVGGVGHVGVTGPEVGGGDAPGREAGHVGPAQLGPGPSAAGVHQRLQQRVAEARRGRHREVDHLELVDLAHDGPQPGLRLLAASGRARSGG